MRGWVEAPPNNRSSQTSPMRHSLPTWKEWAHRHKRHLLMPLDPIDTINPECLTMNPNKLYFWPCLSRVTGQENLRTIKKLKILHLDHPIIGRTTRRRSRAYPRLKSSPSIKKTTIKIHLQDRRTIIQLGSIQFQKCLSRRNRPQRTRPKKLLSLQNSLSFLPRKRWPI
jgi:hypothetical protein